MAIFDNGDLEKFLLFISNFNINSEASGVLVDNTKIQYLCTLLLGEVLSQFDMLYSEIGSTTSEKLKSIILGLGTYFSCQCDFKTKVPDSPRNK